MENRRAMQRFYLHLMSIVNVNSEKPESKMNSQYAVAENICAGGVYLRAIQPLGLNTKVKVEIFLPVQEYMISMYKNISLIKISGKVVRKDDAGMAIEFDKNYSISPLLWLD